MAESQASQASNAFISEEIIVNTVNSVVSNEEASMLQPQEEQAPSEEPTQGVDSSSLTFKNRQQMIARQ